jgi:hypothetical protein
MSKTYLNSNEDMQWLEETHLRAHGLMGARSAVLFGNEDCPDAVELYCQENPLISSMPVCCFRSYDGELKVVHTVSGTIWMD